MAFNIILLQKFIKVQENPLPLGGALERGTQ